MGATKSMRPPNVFKALVKAESWLSQEEVSHSV
jgi:hypothetical protein